MSDLDDQILAFKDSMSKTGQYVNGDDVTDVDTLAGPVPSLAKQARLAQEYVAAQLLDVGIALLTDITGINSGTNTGDQTLGSLGAEAVANKATSFAVVNNTLYPTVQAVKTYADSLIVGVVVDCGNYDASTNVFPSTGGTGVAGAIVRGNLFFISGPGALGGVAVNVGDSVRALINTPGQTAASWDVLESNIGYVPVNTTALGVTVAELVGGKVPSGQIPATTDIVEGGNLYFTAARVLASVIVGLSTATNTVVTATDTVLSAIGKLQAQVSGLVASLTSKAASGANADITSLSAGVSIPGLVGTSSVAVVAAGTTQATATVLTSDINVITTAAAGSGVMLIPAGLNKVATIINRAANPVILYPTTGQQFDDLVMNLGISIPVNGFVELRGSSTTQWFSTLQAIVSASALQGTLSIAQGGHGATTAAAGLAALGGASLAANTFTGGQSYTQTDKGSVNSGTVTFDASAKNVYKLTVGGVLTLATSNWPASGNLGEIFIEIVNGGAFAITMPSIDWILPNTGAPAASFSIYLTAIGRSPASLQSSGTDYIVLWSTNGGTIIKGKIM